jgi:hypothetical protein
MNDYDRVGQALKIYADEMRHYMLSKLKSHYGEGKAWVDAYYASFRSGARQDNVAMTLHTLIKEGKSPEDVFDLVHVKDLLLGNRELFKDDFGRNFNKVITWADEIIDVRHMYAHQQDIPSEDITRTLDSISRILLNIGAEAQVRAIKELRDEQPATPVISSQLGAWWQHAEPHDDIKKGRFDESTFAAKLDDVVAGQAPPEYQQADEFFRKTYLTQELRGLLIDTLKRLAELGGEAVVQLRTPFGGGKTHTLIALYHLIKSAADIEHLPDIQGLLAEIGINHVPHARTAVIVGTEVSVEPRQPEPGVTIHTLWGEIAYQLGGKDGYEIMRASDESRISPSKETLRTLLGKYGRVLILLDELLVYQVRASAVQIGGSNLQAQTFAFLQSLTEVVSSTPGTALVTTFPESHIEYYDHTQAQVVFDTLAKIFGRLESTRVPVQGEEIFEVVRRRLFAHIDEARAKQIVAAYQALYDQYQSDLPPYIRSREYSRRMLRAYPFHPEVIDVLYERWGTMQTFQKTRGVLRLLARIIEHGNMSPAANAMIGLGDVGLDDAQLRATITQILHASNWDPVIASDIVRDDGKAFLLDQERGGEYSKLRLCQATTTAIFMYSHSGGGERGVNEPRLRLALIQPQGITPTLLSDALTRMKGRLYYLYGNGAWVFRVQANLNAVLSERMGQIKPKAIEERLKDALSARAGSGLKTILWPEDNRDVPDNTQLKLVILGPTAPHDDNDAVERARFLLQNQHATGPRINKNTTLYLAGTTHGFGQARQVVRELLALEEISSDRGLELSQDQRQELSERLGRVRERLPETAKACYAYLYEPIDGSSRQYRVYDLAAPIKTARTLADAVTEALRLEDRLLPALDPALIAGGPYGLWPEDERVLKLRDLRDYFHRLPNLPYLENDDVLRSAIVKGIRDGLFEVGLEQHGTYPTIWRRTNPPTPSDLFFADHYHLARPGTLTGSTPEAVTNPDVTAPVAPTAPQNPGVRSSPVTGAPKQANKTRVSLAFDHLQIADLPKLVDIASALEDAGGTIKIEARLTATNAGGLDETVLELSVQELISQFGLDAEWLE